MKYLTKNQQIAIVVALVLVVTISIIILSGSINLSGNQKVLATIPTDLQSDLGKCSGGWTTLSANTVSINGATKIRIYGVAKGSECMRIQFSKNDLNSNLTGTGLQATKDITIGNVKLLKYTETYPIDKTGNYFPALKVDIFGDGLDTCRISLDPFACCKKQGINSLTYPFHTGVLGYYTNCISLGSNGLEGGFDMARSYGDYDVLFDFNGEQYHLTRGQQSINSANGKIHIEWTGNLQNIDKVYAPGYDTRLIFSSYELVQDGAYVLTQNKVSDFVTCYNQQGYQNQEGYNYCKTAFDGDTNSILINKLDKYKKDGSALIYDAKTDANNLFVSLKATPFPTFIIDLDASYFGILALEGKPKITNCISTQNGLVSGQNKVVDLRVKNDANTNNVQFYGSLSCTTGLQGFFTNTYTYFDANEEKTINVELHPSNPNKNQPNLPVSCTVRINDLKSSNYDTCVFTGSVAYDSGIICTPNSLSCDNTFTKVMKCTADGKNMLIFQQCTDGCELYGSGARCREPCPVGTSRCSDGSCSASCGDGGCASCAEWATSIFKPAESKCTPTTIIKTSWNPFTWLSLLLGITALSSQNIVCPILFAVAALVGIFSFLFLLDFLKIFDVISANDKVWIRAVIAGIVAIILAYVTYVAFLIGVVLFVVFLILRFAINMFLPINFLKGLKK